MTHSSPALVVVPDQVRRGLRRAGVPGLALALVLSATAGTAVVRAEEPDGSVAPAGTRALVLSGSSLSYAVSRRAAEQLQWDADVYALPGAGISRSNLDPTGSLTGSARRLLPDPQGGYDVVVLQGGEADHAAAPASLRAVNAVLEAVARSRGIAFVEAISRDWRADDPSLADHLSEALAGG